MISVLGSFEFRLRHHFEILAAAKRQSGQPVFALEHCLETQEVRELGDELNRDLEASRGMDDSLRLCWIVHAAEHGYQFDGQEYWYSFGERTSSWNRYGNRWTLRDWYEEFSKKFFGIQPNGGWGEHYKFIAWPITNALIPKDIQVQLAQSIYNIRYSLRKVSTLTVEGIGRLIEQNSYYPSSRYRFFLQQHDLVGRVVHALLQGDQAEQPAIFRPTLQRIIADLNSRGNAREWLKDAQRQFLKFQFQLPVYKQSYALVDEPVDADVQAIEEDIDAHGILLKPGLSIRRSKRNTWSVTVTIPSFRSLVDYHPEFREHLESVKYNIKSHGPALFPGINLLSGAAIERTIKTWPAERTSLLEFNKANNFFDRIVNVECQLAPGGAVWVFRRREDGTGQHIAMQFVRAGEKYIVIGRSAASIQDLGAPVEIECQGVHGIILDLPEVIPDALVERLRRAGISVQTTLRIEPVGLLPRQWSADGSGEWLLNETPCFAISRDHEFDGYQFMVDDGQIQSFALPDSETGPVYFIVEGLSVGRHEIAVASRASEEIGSGIHSKTLRSISLTVFVRPSSTWTPGDLGLSAMVVDVNPPAPTIDDFLNKRLELRAEGDSARAVVCSLVLTDSAGEAISKKEILTHSLPITPGQWSAAVDKFLKQPTDEQNYLSAGGGHIHVDAGDIGEYRVALRHNPKPLRWVLMTSKTSAQLRLVNDGLDDQPTVEVRSFAHPFESKVVAPSAAISGIDLATTEGLIVANAPEGREGAVVCSGRVGKSMSWLGAQVDRSEFQMFRDIPSLLDGYDLWSSARPCSPISQMRQESVCRFIHFKLLAAVCGVRWARLESGLDDSSKLDPWGDLEREVKHTSLVALLLRDWKESRDSRLESLEACHLKRSAGLKIATDLALIRLAWLVATDPARLRVELAENSLPQGYQFDTLVRGARLLICCADANREIPE